MVYPHPHIARGLLLCHHALCAPPSRVGGAVRPCMLAAVIWWRRSAVVRQCRLFHYWRSVEAFGAQRSFGVRVKDSAHPCTAYAALPRQ